jgi:hypothetical protein
MPCPGWTFSQHCKIFIPYVDDLPFVEHELAKNEGVAEGHGRSRNTLALHEVLPRFFEKGGSYPSEYRCP